MITKEGYSKDKTIRPEAIVVTFGQEMMKEQGGVKLFLENFLQCMADHETGRYWMHKCSNLPTQEVDVVYIIVLNRLYGRVYCGGYKKADEELYGLSADGKEKRIDWPHIVLSGEFEKCPIKRKLKGFQGFRYATKLF